MFIIGSGHKPDLFYSIASHQMTLEKLHLIQNKNGLRQYFTMIEIKEGDTQETLDNRADITADQLEKRFGGFMEIRTTQEVLKSNVNYPRDSKNGQMIFRVSEFA